MLNWFARRLKEAQEKDKTGQGGFTLIELLVVVIIIGILAAIAIPVFLNQREKAQESTVKSDVRNAVTMDTAMRTETGTGIGNNTYGPGALIGSGDNSFRVSEGVTITVDANNITGTYAGMAAGDTWTYQKNTGRYVAAGVFAP